MTITVDVRPEVEAELARGLEFPLKNADLKPGSRGLSNRATGDRPCQIEVRRGRLVVMVLHRLPRT